MFKKPAMYLRDSVIFPNIGEASLLIGREDSIQAIDLAMSDFDAEICIITQLQGENERPDDDEVFPVGTVCEIEKCLNFSDGTRKILIKGHSTFNLKSTIYDDNNTRLVEGEIFDWTISEEGIDDKTLKEFSNLLIKYNPSWEFDEGKNKFESHFKDIKNLDDFVLKVSNLIASPYTGIQLKPELDKIKRNLNYWKEFSFEQYRDMNSRICKRMKLLTALPSRDKLNVIRDILDSET